MTLEEYIQACDTGHDEWPDLLKSLALDRRGDWDGAHSIAQNVLSSPGSAVHARLWNAEYWYKRAGRSPFTGSLEDEWKALAEELLN